MPPDHQRAGDVDGGIGAGDDAYQEGEGEVVDGAATEDVQGDRRQEHRSRGDDRTAEGLVQCPIDDLVKGTRGSHLQIFANTIKDHDGVVDRETDDGQECRYEGGIELTSLAHGSGQTVPTDGHEHVVRHRNHGGDGEAELIAEGHVHQNTEERQHRGDDARLLDLLADGGSDRVHADALELGFRKRLLEHFLGLQAGILGSRD